MTTRNVSFAGRAGLALVLLALASGVQAGEDAGEPVGWRQAIDGAREKLTAGLHGVELSAFGDLSSGYSDAGRQQMRPGAFELDASVGFGNDVQGALALVAEETGTTLAVGFLDFNTTGARVAPHGRLWVEKGYHIQLGRFDVPFGNDWQFFASKDSVSISRPLTTERVMDGGYTDKGLRVLGNDGSVNFNTYLMRGFNNGRLAGARVGVTPFSDPFTLMKQEDPTHFEFGLSYLYDADTAWKKNETATAVDVEVKYGDWGSSFEYVTRRKLPTPDAEEEVLYGWHCTQEYMLDETEAWRTTLFARYEQAETQAADSRDTRVAFGLNMNVGSADVVQWKLEAQHYRAATEDTRAQPGFGKWRWFTQIVVVL